jgi:hypothetical protein
VGSDGSGDSERENREKRLNSGQQHFLSLLHTFIFIKVPMSLKCPQAIMASREQARDVLAPGPRARARNSPHPSRCTSGGAR